MWKRETEIWSRLDHPNIVPFLGISTSEEFTAMPALVSAWMPNGRFLNLKASLSYDLMTTGSVKSYLVSKTLDPAQKHAIVLGVAEGLAYLHSGYLYQL
jgi:serine/threonine protein kinase